MRDGGPECGTPATTEDRSAEAGGRATAPPSRDWCATAFVVWRGRVLLHRHPKLDRWLPPGGHVEADELPDAAAVREVLEETGVPVRLIGERPVEAPGPTALVRPRGVQLEPIRPGHEHVDLIYWARPHEPYDGALPQAASDPSLGWYDANALSGMDLGAEIRAWCALALAELGGG